MNGWKIALIGVAGSVGAYLLYKHVFGYGAIAGNVITPYANPSLVAQPGLAYPYKPNQAPRNDNQSEPWYGSSRGFNTQTAVQGAVSSDFMALAGYTSGFADITTSLTSMWDGLGVSSWWGDDDALDVGTESVSAFNDTFSWGGLEMFA